MSSQENGNSNHVKYYEILELNPDASFSEIKSSYLHLKKLYSSESPVLSPIFDEISHQQNEELLNQIEEAYVYLKDFFATRETEKQKVTRDRVIHKNIPEFEVFSGNALKLTREVLGVELQEIALSTGIPIKHLRNIEKERIDLLPPRGYVRIYITKYAEYLSLDALQVVNDYMKAMYKKKRH
jgi:curved DNA-binding protein CbpA